MPKTDHQGSISQPKSIAEYQEAIQELVNALELCLGCEGLSWEAEREAEILVSRYKQVKNAST